MEEPGKPEKGSVVSSLLFFFPVFSFFFPAGMNDSPSREQRDPRTRTPAGARPVRHGLCWPDDKSRRMDGLDIEARTDAQVQARNRGPRA